MGRGGEKHRSKEREGGRAHDAGSTPPTVVDDVEVTDVSAARADRAVPDEPEPPVIDLDVEPAPGEADGGLDHLIAAAASAGRARGGGPDSPGVDAPGSAGDAVTTQEEEPDEVALGPVSTPEARQRLLSETLAHAAMQDARYRVPIGSRRAGRIKATVALAIFAVAGFVALVPPSVVTPDPPARLAEEDHRYGAQVVLLLQAQQVEAFRLREQRVPASLAEVSGTIPGLRFIRSGSRAYQLVAYTPDGEALVYDSAAPDPAFASLDLEWWRPGGS